MDIVSWPDTYRGIPLEQQDTWSIRCSCGKIFAYKPKELNSTTDNWMSIPICPDCNEDFFRKDIL